MKNIKEIMAQFAISRRIAILICQLDITFQPNKGSSLYRLPTKKKIAISQRDWNCPIGTLRLSDHWNYENRNEEKVFKTDQPVPKNVWSLAINYGPTYEEPWHVVQIFERYQKPDFGKIQRMVKKAIGK